MLDPTTLSVGFALDRDRRVPNSEVSQFVLHVAVAVAAICCHSRRCTTGAPLATFDRRNKMGGVGRVALLDVVISDGCPLGESFQPVDLRTSRPDGSLLDASLRRALRTTRSA